MRRSDIEEIGGYDARFPHTSDLAMWLQAAGRGGVGRVNGAVQALYRDHGQNMHLTRFAGALTDLRECRRTFETFVSDPEVVDGNGAVRVDQMRRALSHAARRYAIIARQEGGSGAARTAADLTRFADDWTRPRGPGSLVRCSLSTSGFRRSTRARCSRSFSFGPPSSGDVGGGWGHERRSDDASGVQLQGPQPADPPGIAWSGAANLVLRIGSLVVGICLARLLSPEHFGVYGVALIVQTILMSLADLGLSADLIRSDEPERRLRRWRRSPWSPASR